MASAASLGLVKPRDHVVVVQRVHDDFCVKVTVARGASSPCCATCCVCLCAAHISANLRHEASCLVCS